MPTSTFAAVLATTAFGLGAVSGSWMAEPDVGSEDTASAAVSSSMPKVGSTNTSQLEQKLRRTLRANWELSQENLRLKMRGSKTHTPTPPSRPEGESGEQFSYTTLREAIEAGAVEEATAWTASLLRRGEPGFEVLAQELQQTELRALKGHGSYEEERIGGILRLGFTECAGVIEFAQYLAEQDPSEKPSGALKTFQRFMNSDTALLVVNTCHDADEELLAGEVARWSAEGIRDSHFLQAMLTLDHPSAQDRLLERFDELPPHTAERLLRRLGKRADPSARELLKRIAESTEKQEQRLAALEQLESLGE